MLVTCFSTARSVTVICVGDRVVRAPLGHQLHHLALARRELGERVVAAGTAHELGHHLRVERRAALGHARDRLHEAIHVRHAVLEQVADAAGGVAHQVEGVALLHVLGEHEHPRVGVRGPDLERGPQAVVCVRRRHAYVHHCNVGLVGVHLTDQVLGVARLGHHVEALLLQQPHHALAQQHRVVRHDYPHGILALIVVPWPCSDSTSSRPSSTAMRSASPRRPVPRRGIGAADPVVGHLHDHAAVVALHLHGRVRGLRVLGHVRERLGDHEVGGQLHRLGQALVRQLAELHRHGRAVRERLQRSGEAAVGEHGRVDSASQLAQLLERGIELCAGARQQLLGRERVLVQLGAREPDVERHRDEPLLRPVVQVALEPAALLEPDLEHALARAAQLVDLRAQRGIQPLVVKRKRGGRAHGLHVPAHLRERRVVHDRGHALAFALDLGDRALRVVLRQLVIAPARVDVAPAARGARRRAPATGPRARRRARRAPGRARGAALSLDISSPTAPPCAMRARTNDARNR